MGKTTRIIEFFGLPGGGKSTVCENLLSRPELKAVKISGMMRCYQRESRWFKLTHLPLTGWLRLIIFLCSLSGKRKNSSEEYKTLFYLSLAYHYSKYQNNYDYLLVDHGLVQQLGSILHNMDFHISDCSLKKFISFLNGQELVIPFYCRLPKEVALERMHRRGRNTGRVDAVMHDTPQALSLMEKESILFDKIASMKASNVTLDMTKSVGDLTNEIINEIKKRIT